MRLTPFAKAFIVLVVLGAGGYVAWYRLGQRPTEPPAAAAVTEEKQDTPAAPKAPRSGKRIVVGVNDFGGAYPGVVANDGAVAGPGSRFSAAGLDVEVKLIRGSKERLAAFDAGEVDIMLLTLDYFANLVPVYQDKGVPIRAFLMADWSRGNLGIVSRPEIKSIEALKGAKIATTRNTPTHYFLLTLLRRSNLTQADIDEVKSNLVFATKTPQAGELFRRGEVDAVAIWEPHLSQSMADGKGRLLVSTATATNYIADVLFAREDYLKAHESEINAFVAAWFEGVAALDRDPKAGVATIAKAFGQSIEETQGVLGKIKPATFADNRAFFGLERERYAYFSQYDEASRVWLKEQVITRMADIASTRWLKALEAMQQAHREERIIEAFHFDGGPKAGVAPLLTKSVSIYFASGDATLEPNARQLLDGLGEPLAEFGNAYVRVEGNTDSTGSRAANVALSKRRAAALVDYLVAQHGFDRARFQAVGNGPDKPVGDNSTEAGREANRRTDFSIIPNQ